MFVLLTSILALVTFISTAQLAAAESLPPEAQRLYEKAREDGKWFSQAQKLSPEIFPTSDGRSFVVVWKPNIVTPDRWVVSLHGSRGFATDDLAIWQKYLAPRGMGFIGLQWWFGEEDGPQGYYAPDQIYRELDVALKRAAVRPGTAMLHGFSRGSANIYAVAALDASTSTRYFSLFLANAGRASPDYPPNRALADGRFGKHALRQTRWITVCGGRDPHPDRDGCPGMRATGQWLVEQGAAVVAAIEDPDGDHGAFHRNPRNVNRALDLFEAK